MNLEPNQLIDNRYKIIEKLGEGGMGAVWRAQHAALGDEVVLKMPLFHNDPEMLKRFSKEAQTMRKHSIECPHILNIEDIGELDGVPWYVMRFLPGGSVRDRVLPRDEMGAANWDQDSFEWLIKIASALDYLHGKQAYHRDVKPENILFSQDGTPYLVDFGIVKTVNETTSMMTEQGKAVGTMAYMAPEILDGGKFAGQSDQYSLAITLYETLTGERPFSGTTFFALFKSIQKGHRKLAELHPVIPRAASDTVDRALSQNPEARFGSCLEFANEFISGMKSSKASPSEAVTGVHAGAVGGKPIASPSVAGNLGSGDSLFTDAPITPEPVAGGESSKSALFATAALLIAGLVFCGSLYFGGAFSGSSKPDQVPVVSPDSASAASAAKASAAPEAANSVAELESRIITELSLEKYEISPLSLVEQHADLGFASAQFNLGKRHRNGKGAEKDYTEAVNWFRKAAEQDLASAQYNLGVMYANGTGVSQDEKESVKWYRKAAEHGHLSLIHI